MVDASLLGHLQEPDAGEGISTTNRQSDNAHATQQWRYDIITSM